MCNLRKLKTSAHHNIFQPLSSLYNTSIPGAVNSCCCLDCYLMKQNDMLEFDTLISKQRKF
jgi:hypothetical protein